MLVVRDYLAWRGPRMRQGRRPVREGPRRRLAAADHGPRPMAFMRKPSAPQARSGPARAALAPGRAEKAALAVLVAWTSPGGTPWVRRRARGQILIIPRVARLSNSRRRMTFAACRFPASSAWYLPPVPQQPRCPAMVTGVS